MSVFYDSQKKFIIESVGVSHFIIFVILVSHIHEKMQMSSVFREIIVMEKTIFTMRSQVMHYIFKYSEQLSITFSSKEKIKNG